MNRQSAPGPEVDAPDIGILCSATVHDRHSTGQGRLLATTALVPTVPDAAPLAGAWPQQTVFAAFDAAILNALINSQLAGQTFAGHWQKTFKIVVVSVTVKADYQVKVSNVAVDRPGQDGQLRGTANLDIVVNLKVSNLASFTADATATPTARVTVSIMPDNQVVAKLDELDSVKLNFRLPQRSTGHRWDPQPDR